MSVAFADNASSGIEPAFAWTGTRRILQRDGRVSVCAVENHAWRVYRALVGPLSHPLSPLPPAFVTATEVQPQDHLVMMQAVQPYVDAAISKTVNLAPDVPYDRFEALYLQAWRSGLKGLAVYRPSGLRPGVMQAVTTVPAGQSSGLPAPGFPDLAVSCGVSHASQHRRPMPRGEVRDVHQGVAGL